MCLLVLGKDRRTLRIVTRVRLRQNVVERVRFEPFEHRKIGNQRLVEHERDAVCRYVGPEDGCTHIS